MLHRICSIVQPRQVDPRSTPKATQDPSAQLVCEGERVLWMLDCVDLGKAQEFFCQLIRADDIGAIFLWSEKENRPRSFVPHQLPVNHSGQIRGGRSEERRV